MSELINLVKIYKRNLQQDSRGWFLKIIDGKESDLPKRTGEIYLTSANPGQCKGGHYHIIAREWFTLVQGKAVLKLKDIETMETLNINLDAENPVTVFVPPLIAHSICNISDIDFILCAYSDQLFDPADTKPFEL